MISIETGLEQALEDAFLNAALEKIAEKFADQGIVLSKRERRLLHKYILNGANGTFNIRRWEIWDHRHIQIDLTTKELDEIQSKFEVFLKHELFNILESTSAELSRRLVPDLKRRWRSESRRQRREFSGFAKRLRDRWREPLAGLEMLLTIAREFGAGIHEELSASSVESRKHLNDVVVRSHARACQITNEIIWLLSGGFADGAMARWRTLHEVAVVAFFIAHNGEALAERYVLHQAVESRRAALDYRNGQERLGLEPLDDGSLEALEVSYEAAISRFGSEFGGPYGWASEQLRQANPRFASIERAVNLDHMRAYYRMASHNVHANPNGVFFRLGLMNERQSILAGASNGGLADPGGCTATSIVQVTAALALLAAPTFYTGVVLKVMGEFAKDTGEAFQVAHDQLKDEQ